jgi:hypothetical protein
MRHLGREGDERRGGGDAGAQAAGDDVEGLEGAGVAAPAEDEEGVGGDGAEGGEGGEVLIFAGSGGWLAGLRICWSWAKGGE